MRANHLSIICCILLLSAGYCAAQNKHKTQTRDQQSVEKILDSYIHAIGGKIALSRIRTVFKEGTFHEENGPTYIDGTFAEYFKAPNRYKLVLLTSEGQRLAKGYDGEVAWISVLDHKAIPMGLGEKEMLLARDAFLWPSNGQHLFSQMFVGTEQVNNRAVYAIKALLRETSHVFYFDGETQFLVRRISLANANDVRTTDYSDFRAVDGVIFPFTEADTNTDGSKVMGKILTIQCNTALDEKMFSMKSEEIQDKSISSQTNLRP
jgi:hypothetical protein